MRALHFLQAGAAFALAAIWSLFAMPAALQAGKRLGMVTHPRLFGRSERRTVSYLGGVGLAGAATVGFGLSQGVSLESLTILLAGAVLLFLGFMDDRSEQGGLPVWVRLSTEVGVSALAWLAGLRFAFFGSDLPDAFLTVLVLVAVSNAFNLLDNMDGIAGATACGCAISLFAIASVTGQHNVAALAAALCGASLGFLRHNLIKAKVFLGNGGTLFLGFLLAATALKVQIPQDTLSGGLALLVLFAIPATDTSVAVISRFVSGRAILQGGTDHLSHRIVKLGASQGTAALVHVLGSLAAGAAVVVWMLTKRSWILAVALLVFALAAIVLLWQGRGKTAPLSVGRRLVIALLIFFGLASASSLSQAVPARTDLLQARDSMLLARSHFSKVNLSGAREELANARTAFDRANDRLTSPLALPGRAVPVLGTNLRAARSLSSGGAELAGAGIDAVALLTLLRVEADGGLPLIGADGFDIQTLSGAAESVDGLSASLAVASRQIQVSGGSWLLPSVRQARIEAIKALSEARSQIERANGVTSLMPSMFGAEKKRTWLLAGMNPAELRGRGGFFGTYGFLHAERGKLKAEGFVPTTSLPPLNRLTPGAIPAEYRTHYGSLGALDAWGNLNMSPHFPSAGRVVLSRIESSGLTKADGVIAIDPVAMSYLLGATGPVTVEGISVPVSAENVVDLSTNELYFTYPDDQTAKRKEVLVRLGEAVLKRVTSGEATDPKALTQAFGRATREHHLVLYSSDPSEQKLIESLGLGGDVKDPKGDYLMVLAQNFGENKMDYYVHRTVSYDARVDHDDVLHADLDITLRNDAPTGVEFPLEAGGARPHLKMAPGVARSHVSAFVPRNAVIELVLVDGKPTGEFDNRVELGKRQFAVELRVAPQQTTTVRFKYRVSSILVQDGYQLLIQNQATINPDQVTLNVALPSYDALRAARNSVGETLTFKGALTSDRRFRLDPEVPLNAELLAGFSNWLTSDLFQVGN